MCTSVNGGNRNAVLDREAHYYVLHLSQYYI